MRIQPFEDLVRQLIEIVPNATLVVDRQGSIVRVNSRVLSLFGYAREDLIGKPMANLMPERLREKHIDQILDFIAGPTLRPLSNGLEFTALRSDGSEFPVDLGLSPFETDIGRRVVVSIADMTEHSRTLLQSRQVFQDAIRSLGVAIVMVDAGQRIKLINEAAEKLFGYAEAELLEKPLTILLPARFREKHTALAAEFIAGRHTRPMANGRDLTALRKNGEECVVEISLTPLESPEGRMVLAAVWDLSERMLAEEKIRSREAHMLKIYESLAQPVLVMGVESGQGYRLLSVNSAFSKFVGLPKEVLAGRLLDEAFPAAISSEIAIHLKECEETGAIVRWNQTSEVPTGRVSGINICSPIFDEHGKCVQLVISIHDVTGEQQAEAARRTSEQLLKTVFDTLPVHLVVKDTETRYLMVNRAWCERYGLTPEQVIGKKSMEIPGRPLADRMHTLEQDRNTLAAETNPVTFEGWDKTATGEIRHYQSIRAPIRDEQGKVTGLVGATVDLTELKRAEQNLRENEARLALIYEAVAEPLVLLTVEPDDRFRFASANAAFCRFQSLPRDKIEGKLLGEVVPAGIAQTLSQHFREARDSGSTVRWEQVSDAPAGLRISLNACTPIMDDRARCTQLVIAIHDATAERAAEAAHRKSEASLALQYAVAQALVSGSTLAEAAPKFLQTLCEATGWKYGGLWMVDRSANVLRYVAGWHLPDRILEDFVQDSMSRTVAPGQGGPGRVWTGASLDWLGKVPAPGGLGRKGTGIHPALKSALGLPVLVNQQVVGVLEFFSQDIREPDAEFAKTLSAICAQIAQVIQTQINADQLRQAQKMEAVGQLAGGVAHDFNNLLTVILSHAEFILDDSKASQQLREDAKVIQETGDRAAALTRQLLAFSRRQVMQLKNLDLNKTVANLEKMLRRLIGEDIELTTSLDKKLLEIRADETQIEQIILNLCVNARDAMPKGGKLEIETANRELDDSSSPTYREVVPGQYVMLAVSDNGQGMNADTQKRIFEPFFTTKPMGKGTGLGLAMVYGIVKQLNGLVFVYSEPGEGTTFKFYFPALARGGIAPDVPAPAAIKRVEAATVLLVEDEDLVRRTATRILEGAGYAVLAAASANEGLKIYGSDGDKIDLLLSDVVMPGASGHELLTNIQKARPIRVIFMSGFTDDAIIRHGILQGNYPFINKPFTKQSLLAKVRDVLSLPVPDSAAAS